VVINALFGRGLIEDNEISYSALGAALELLTDSINGVQLPAWVPTPHNLKFQRMMRELDVSVYRTIRAAREREGDPTLLSMLLAARDEQGQPLSDSTLRDEVLTLFVAGHETTALTLTWLFALVSEAPEVVARMRAEVDAVVAGREPTFADVHQLSYVRQVIDESLRLRPPAPMLARNAVAEDKLGKFDVEAGGSVLAFTWAVHRHPDFWPDPLRFDPERFAPGAAKGRHVCSYIPFGAGPRICIGNAFSLIEGALLIAQMFTRFDIEVASCADVKPLAVGTVRPSKPVRVRLTRRRQN
jgi:cytochrome P450